jgi:1-acyl-sn-glycerol-3-phosphate acyltransferase
MLLFDACRIACRVFLSTFYRVRPQHLDRVPHRGAVLIVANHQSFLDPPLVGCFMDFRHTDFIARGGLFKFKPFGWLIAALNSIPVGEGASETAAIKEALRRLGMGRAVILFPEGSRSPDGAMRPFKRGIAVLVKKAGCPVIPAAIEGVHDAWPRERSRPFLLGKRIALRYGEPIPHAELMADGPDAALRRLEREIDAMRLQLRAELRERTRGRFPPPGAGDHPFDPGASAAED